MKTTSILSKLLVITFVLQLAVVASAKKSPTKGGKGKCPICRVK